jgi:hypothetical protein
MDRLQTVRKLHNVAPDFLLGNDLVGSAGDRRAREELVGHSLRKRMVVYHNHKRPITKGLRGECIMYPNNVATDNFLPCCLGVDRLIACQSETFDPPQGVRVAINARSGFVDPARVAKGGGRPGVDRVQCDQ